MMALAGRWIMCLSSGLGRSLKIEKVCLQYCRIDWDPKVSLALERRVHQSTRLPDGVENGSERLLLRGGVQMAVAAGGLLIHMSAPFFD
jgi:hypothetical protein